MIRTLAIGLVCSALLAWGCAITDYPVITDTEGDAEGFIVSTNGKALIRPSPEWGQALIGWPDQNEELFSMVDQKPDGDQVIDTYLNVSFGFDNWETKLLDFEYCNPDWTGCSIITSYDPNVPGDPFFNDWVLNPQCSGYRSLENLVAYSERTGECGRSFLSRSNLRALADWVDSGVRTPDGERYVFRADRDTLRISAIDPLGRRRRVPVFGTHEVEFVPGKGIGYAIRPNLRPTALEMVRLSERHGVTHWEFEYLGHGVEVHMKVLDRLGERLRGY